MGNIKNWSEFLKDVPTQELENEIKNRKKVGFGDLHEVTGYLMECLENALEDFGHYTFEDKGSYEVMDVPEVVSKFSGMGYEEVGNILIEFLDNWSGRSTHSESFANDILNELADVYDNQGDEDYSDFQLLLDMDERFVY
jgi:hypothetical protein